MKDVSEILDRFFQSFMKQERNYWTGLEWLIGVVLKTKYNQVVL